MIKPRVLIFIDWFAPGFKAGGPTTSNVNIVDHLSDEIDFYVITSNTDYHAEKPYTEVKSDCWVDRGNCKAYYFSKANLSLKNIISVAREADCTTWYINGIYSRYFSLYPLIAAKIVKPTKLTVSARGMLSPHALAIKSYIKKPYIAFLKLFRFYSKVLFHGTNQMECEYIKAAVGKNAKTVAIDNLPRKLRTVFIPTKKEKGIVRLVSFARISPEKNTLYAIKALSLCKTKVVYHIYGQINSESYWKECETAICKLPANVEVKYCGSVNPDKLSILYADYDAMYLPSTGENFGHAILESFMNSRPVIISDKTPWRNLEEKGIGFDIPHIQQRVYGEKIDMLSDMSNEDFNIIAHKSYEFARNVCDNADVRSAYLALFK